MNALRILPPLGCRGGVSFALRTAQSSIGATKTTQGTERASKKPKLVVVDRFGECDRKKSKVGEETKDAGAELAKKKGNPRWKRGI